MSKSSSKASSSETASMSIDSLSIQMVPKSVSNGLLGSFFDASQFDFKYEQSSHSSPPLRQSVYLDSLGNAICCEEDDETWLRLESTKRAQWRNRIFRSSNEA